MLLQELFTAHDWHIPIQDDCVKASLLEDNQRLLSVCGIVRRVSMQTQAKREQLRQVTIIVDDEDLLHAT
jgi:hypothetical protein